MLQGAQRRASRSWIRSSSIRMTLPKAFVLSSYMVVREESALRNFQAY
jgi:hypothetical protein